MGSKKLRKQNMVYAIKDVRSRKLGYTEAADTLIVPGTTLFHLSTKSNTSSALTQHNTYNHEIKR